MVTSHQITTFFNIYWHKRYIILYYIVHLNKEVNTWVSITFTNVSGGIPSQDTLLLNWLATETSRLTFLKLKMF